MQLLFTLSWTDLRCAVLPHQTGLVVYLALGRWHAGGWPARTGLWLALSRARATWQTVVRCYLQPRHLPLCRRFSHCPVQNPG